MNLSTRKSTIPVSDFSFLEIHFILTSCFCDFQRQKRRKGSSRRKMLSEWKGSRREGRKLGKKGKGSVKNGGPHLRLNSMCWLKRFIHCLNGSHRKVVELILTHGKTMELRLQKTFAGEPLFKFLTPSSRYYGYFTVRCCVLSPVCIICNLFRSN